MAVSTANQLRYSYEEYLRALEMSVHKLEYSAGLIYARPGGTPAHAQLSASVMALLHGALPRTCSAFSCDARVRVEAADFTGFPDGSVVRGERRTSPIDRDALANPTLLVEVTSRSTEEYDRGEKLQHYQQLPSLEVVLFISHRERRVTVVERRAGQWQSRECVAGATVSLSSPAVSFTVDELYGNIPLDP